MYALDTNTVIYFFKDLGKVKERLLKIKPKDIFIPSIVCYELKFGILKTTQPQKKLNQLSQLLDTCNICSFGKKEYESSAEIRTNLEKKGQSIGPLDVLIAGTALANNYILVTRNIREFKRVEGLKLVDWY